MAENEQDDIEGKDTPPASSTGKETNPKPSGDGAEADADDSSGDTTADDKKDDEPLIPKHRLDEEVAKRRALEEEFAGMKTKFVNMGRALQGQPAEVKDEMVASLSQKYNVSESFIEDMLKVSEKRVSAKYEQALTPLKQAQAKQAFQSELSELQREVPEARDMTDEEVKQLTKLAYDPRYSKTPIADIYKIMSYGKPQGRRRTAEGSRGGAGRSGSDEAPDISKMSMEEFEKYSEGLAKKG